MPGRILEELKQRRPFEHVEEEALLNILKTADQLTQAVSAVVKEHDLSPEQYNVLRILRGAGVDGLKCSEIGARMITHDPDMTRLLDRLEKRGLVTRARDTKDRRAVVTRATPVALGLLEKLDPRMTALHQRTLGHLGRQRVRLLVELLEEVRSVAGEKQGETES